MKVWRDGRERALEAKIGERELARQLAERAAGDRGGEQAGAGGNSLGIRVAPVDEAARRQLELDEEVQGVVVTALRPDGPAATQGVRVGDVIVGINRDPIASAADLEARIEAVRRQGRQAALLRIRRDGAYHFVAVPV